MTDLVERLTDRLIPVAALEGQDLSVEFARLLARSAIDELREDEFPDPPRSTTWTDLHGVEHPVETMSIPYDVWRKLNSGSI